MGRAQSDYMENISKLQGSLSLESLRLKSTAATAAGTPLPNAVQYGYIEFERLGSGTFGTVYKMRRTDTWKAVAGKKLFDKHYLPDTMSIEAAVLQDIRHRHIVRYLDYYTPPNSDIPILVTEFCKRQTVWHLGRNSRLQPWQVITIVEQTASALEHLHNRNIAHRDLKPANILVRSHNPFVIAVADFGWAKIDASSCMKTYHAGTPAYMAPEQFEQEDYNTSVDVWALGIIALQYMAGRFPYPPFQVEGMEFKTVDIKYLRYLTTDLFAKTFEPVRHEHQNVQDFIVLIKEMLSWTPAERPAAKSVRKRAGAILDSLPPCERPPAYARGVLRNGNWKRPLPTQSPGTALLDFGDGDRANDSSSDEENKSDYDPYSDSDSDPEHNSNNTSHETTTPTASLQAHGQPQSTQKIPYASTQGHPTATNPGESSTPPQARAGKRLRSLESTDENRSTKRPTNQNTQTTALSSATS
ncbi:kinase-like domain-containing protein [Bombardia bombarda]|uniref:Autophagy-related protein 1 n=1 Tax=Bombardia bombarda TaxID=252184 RepID=A0AA39X0I3_9PEZI|nr:kinase-like domain-containing protein [Bombardia bombarda]